MLTSDIDAEYLGQSSEDEVDDYTRNLLNFFPAGCKGTWFYQFPTPSTTMRCENMSHVFAVLQHLGEGIDMCELCGGEARPTTLAIRRRLKTGKNFDLTTNVDLGKRADQDQVSLYIIKYKVLVVVMGPSCRAVGPPSRLNAVINYDTWKKHLDEDYPHIWFCGQVALVQIEHERYFFLENHWPTYLIQLAPWPEVQKHLIKCPYNGFRIVDQCHLGRRGPHGLPAKKPTLVLSNGEEILDEFDNLRCEGRHAVHDTAWGNGQLYKQQVWTWRFAERLVNGITKLVRRVSKTQTKFCLASLLPEMILICKQNFCTPITLQLAQDPATRSWHRQTSHGGTIAQVAEEKCQSIEGNIRGNKVNAGTQM